jgi:periplasmic copper chaperone A
LAVFWWHFISFKESRGVFVKSSSFSRYLFAISQQQLPQSVLKTIAILAIIMEASTVFAHVTLEDQAALAGRSYKAVLKVGHGCEGSPTTAMRVTVPTGFMGAKPMPKAGWMLAIKTAKLAVPYDNHGKQVTEDVSEITWTATSKDSYLPEAHYDEFILRGGLPSKVNEGTAMWFKVLQTCEKGSNDWSQTPVSGVDTQGLKSPAALLEIIPSGTVGHQH